MLIKTIHKDLTAEALHKHLIKVEQSVDIVALQEQIGKAEVGIVVEHIKGLCYGLILQVSATERHRLIEHRERVAHTTVGLLGNKVERLVVGSNTLILGDVAQILNCILHADTIKVVNLTTGEDGWDNLMFLGGSQDENCVLRRLLKGLEEGVKSRLREHMHLVDDKDRVATHLRDDAHLLNEVTDILHRVV